ncbi:MAG: hypothetical protein COA50_07855 [Flavobacteriaceae bacterium]|nr:MAG: hypothetical protein COA50_07855 [Flavobacteriaceae bacterium]
MRQKSIFFIGVFGVSLFVFTCILGGFLIEDYSIISQYISETFAIDTQYGFALRVFGHIPSGILFTLFCLLAPKYFPSTSAIKNGFYGIGFFYGIGTVIVALFPCDSGCNKEFIDPSISQIIHNLMALLVYVFVPLCMIIIGVGLKKFVAYKRLSILAIALGAISILFVYILTSESNSDYLGLYQRIIESTFVVWILACAFKIKNYKIPI